MTGFYEQLSVCLFLACSTLVIQSTICPSLVCSTLVGVRKGDSCTDCLHSLYERTWRETFGHYDRHNCFFCDHRTRLSCSGDKNSACARLRSNSLRSLDVAIYRHGGRSCRRGNGCHCEGSICVRRCDRRCLESGRRDNCRRSCYAAMWLLEDWASCLTSMRRTRMWFRVRDGTRNA